MIRVAVWCVVLFSISRGTASASQQPRALDDVPEFQGMRGRWSELMGEFEVPGVAVAIVRDGRILAIETLGVRTPDAAGGGGASTTPDTMFYVASITKTYLATAVCALAEDGKLSLDDPVTKHLPRFALGGGSIVGPGNIAIRDLLCHKPGLGGSGAIGLLDTFTGEITDDRFYRLLEKRRSRGQVGYSNLHYTLLGRVVEAASGRPWQQYLHERVLEPAGLSRTMSSATRMYADADCAMPMELVDGEWRVCRLLKTDRTMHAAGGLGVSAHDAARWLMLHVNDGEIDGRRVLSAARAREMRALHGAFGEKKGSIRIMEGFGLGWEVGTFHGAALCAHGGGFEGAAAYYALLPEQKSGFAILMNTGVLAGALVDVIAVDILDRLMDGDERVDVVEAYRQRAAKLREQLRARPMEREAETLKPFELTRPVDAYAGRFLNEDLGTLTASVKGARLGVALGECELDVAPAGPEAFRVLGPVLEGRVFRFVVSPGGRVGAISLDLSDEGTFLFER